MLNYSVAELRFYIILIIIIMTEEEKKRVWGILRMEGRKETQRGRKQGETRRGWKTS